MDCPVCGTAAEDVTKQQSDCVTVRCPACGSYNISRSALSEKRWTELKPDQRRKVMTVARQRAEPGELPTITTYMLPVLP